MVIGHPRTDNRSTRDGTEVLSHQLILLLLLGKLASRTGEETVTPMLLSARNPDQIRALPSLYVRNFPVQESHFQILVHINLFGPEIHFLVGLAHGCFDLIRSHSLLDARRFGRRRLRRWLLLLTLILTGLLTTLLIPALLLAAALVLLRVLAADRQHLSDGIFYPTGSCARQGSFRKLEHDIRL